MRPYLFATLLSVTYLLPVSDVDATETVDFLPHWYAGFSIAHNSFSNANNSTSAHNGLSAIVDGVHLGYQFNPYLSSEIEYQYLGSAGDVAIPGRLNGDFQQGLFSVHLGYPVTNNIYPYVKLGASGWFGDVNQIGGLNTEKYEGVSGVFGAGVSYKAFDNFALRLEYQYTDDIGNQAINVADHQRVSLGLSWSFGYIKPCIVARSEPPVEKVIVKAVVMSDIDPETSLFDVDSRMPKNLDSLASMIAFMQQYPKTIVTITGHTDSAGREIYNQKLSEIRAGNIANHFVERGIAADRVTVIGQGELKPIANNDSVEGRAMNRRVEIHIRH